MQVRISKEKIISYFIDPFNLNGIVKDIPDDILFKIAKIKILNTQIDSFLEELYFGENEEQVYKEMRKCLKE